jgi:hypothetical protein
VYFDTHHEEEEADAHQLHHDDDDEGNHNLKISFSSEQRVSKHGLTRGSILLGVGLDVLFRMILWLDDIEVSPFWLIDSTETEL